MPSTEWSGPSEPYEVKLGHVHPADGVIVATVKLPDAPSELGVSSGKPAILFEFAQTRPDGIHRWPPVVLTFHDAEEPEALVRLIRSAVDDLALAATWKPKPPATPTHCPGCNVKLFGAIAERGGCLACFPVLPGDQP